jgi:DNA-binding NarL/FixJ family response regulator
MLIFLKGRNMADIRIVLADANDAYRVGLSKVIGRQLDMDLVGIATDGKQAVRLIQQLKPDIALLDILLPPTNGFEIARLVNVNCPKTAIIMVSVYSESKYINSDGANIVACIGKDTRVTSVMDTVRTIFAQRTKEGG